MHRQFEFLNNSACVANLQFAWIKTAQAVNTEGAAAFRLPNSVTARMAFRPGYPSPTLLWPIGDAKCHQRLRMLVAHSVTTKASPDICAAI